MMKRLLNMFRQKENRFERLVVLFTGFWMFLIPFGKGEQVPAAILAVMGLYQLLRTKGCCMATPAAKGFLLLISLYVIPIAISLIDAVSFRPPLTVFLTGLGSGLAGVAIISAATDRRFFRQITLILVAIVGFWFLDAGIQAIFGRDIFGLIRQGDRLSGPFRDKGQMGYYSGPFSALLLIFALQKKWKPVLLWAVFIFTVVIVLLNNSRGGWVMYGVVAAVFGYWAFIAPTKHKWLTILLVMLLTGGILFGLYHNVGSFKKRADQTLLLRDGSRQKINRALSGRVAVFESAVGIIRDYPVNGIGARNYRLLCEQYWPDDLKEPIDKAMYPHQLILEYAVGTGAIGVLGLFISMGLCLRWWRRASVEQREMAAGYALALLALYFPLNTHKSLFSSELSVSLWVLIALYTASIRYANPSESIDEPRTLTEKCR